MNPKLESWKKEIKNLTRITGVSEEEVCDYLEVSYSHITSWHKRIPVKRETLIGIGMAYGQDLNLINDWIVRYGDKRKLYAKDVYGDLVWVYLINANAAENAADTPAALSERINYYKLFKPCREMIRETYIGIWNDYVDHPKDTAEVESDLETVEYDPGFDNLRAFVIENIDSFKTAYSKSRKMLNDYVQAILDTYTKTSGAERTPINFLRGYLDDAMINYVCGDTESIHVMDMKSKGTTVNMKPIPKLRKTHIALCLALGMTAAEVNTYLEMMGYAALNPENAQDRQLIEALAGWDARHPDVERFKRCIIKGDTYGIMSDRDSLQAVSDMLMLRSDLEYEYSKNGWSFPYLKG